MFLNSVRNLVLNIIGIIHIIGIAIIIKVIILIMMKKNKNIIMIIINV